MIGQIAGALDAAHARGLVHRDVKPANVLLTLDEPEHAYLTDFGVAKPMGALNRVTRVGQWVGTLDYLAPEQIRGEDVDAGADIYALAGLLYTASDRADRLPARERGGHNVGPYERAPAPPSDLRPDLPRGARRGDRRGMAKDPAERFESAGALARACAEALGIAVDGRARPVPEAEPVDRGIVLGDSASTMLSE